MPTEALAVPHRHPWLDQFMAAPGKGLRELLAGSAQLGPLALADIPDAVRTIFDSVSADGDEVATLDREVRDFLKKQRLAPVPEKRSMLLSSADALRLISRMKLASSANEIRKDMESWFSWVEACPRTNDLDLRAELFSALALTQRLVDHDTFRLEPFWFTMCEQVGRTYPRSYLGIALLGLRMLPERENQPGERAWLAGLLRWGVFCRPPVDEFTFEWRALRSLYPRTSAHWRSEVAELLRQHISRELPSEIYERWCHDVGLTSGDEGQIASDPLWIAMGAPKEAQSIIDRLGAPLVGLAPEIRLHMQSRERYAEATGNYYFLAASACNIGMRLLERGPREETRQRAQLATDLAQITLRWDPASVYGWALWRDALAASGAYEAAEVVGWEAIRRFPENEQWRNQLALLLADLNRTEESRVLLHETIARFPRDAVARNQLADLALESGEHSLAMGVLEPAISAGFADGAVFYTYARAVYEVRGASEAIAIVDRGLIQDSTHENLIWLRDQIVEGRLLAPLASSRISSANSSETASLPQATERGGRMRRLQAKLGAVSDPSWEVSALAEVRAELNVDPHSEYAAFILHEIKPEENSGGFVVAFRDAMERRDSDLLQKLEAQAVGRRPVFDVANAFLFSDMHAATRVSRWLSTDPYQETRANAALRRFIELRVGERVNVKVVNFNQIEPGRLIEILAANDNIRQDLLEVTVASLAFPMAA